VSDQPEDMAARTRDGKGRFDRDPDTVKRDGEAAALRARSWTYRQIGEALGMSTSSAHEAVQRALADTLEEPAAAVRALELEKLDALERAVLVVLEREHVTVSQGRVVRRRTDEIEKDKDGEDKVDGDGNPVYVWEDILDDSPVLAAVDRLLKVADRRAKLLGLDSATKIDVSGGVKYEIVGVSADQL
jgi:hypothetical protein